MNLPNSLTLVRMFLVPLLVVVLLTEFEGRRILGVSKELLGAAIFALRSMAYNKGVTIPASPLGKIKMASQVTAILLLILGWGPMPALAPLGYVALWVVMVAAVVSAVDYYRRFVVLTSAHVTDVNIARERKAG